MEAIDTMPDIDAAIAFSPGVRYGGGSGALDPTIVERILQRARVGRVAVVFPKDDTLFGSDRSDEGRTTKPALVHIYRHRC